MDEKQRAAFCEECKEYFDTLSVHVLRACGQTLGLIKPTSLCKENLIKEITDALLADELQKRSKRGAPVKNVFLPPDVFEKMKFLRQKCVGVRAQEFDCVPKADFSRWEERGCVYELDEEGRIPTTEALRRTIGVTPRCLVEGRIYQSETGERVFVVKKYNG